MILWYELVVTPDEVSVWCRETPHGCWLDYALEGLRAAGFEIDDLTGSTLEDIRDLVLDPELPEPVIVTLQAPSTLALTDHAVVVAGAREDDREMIEYMDPLIGRMVELPANQFRTYWEPAGGRAFIIRP